MDPWGNFEREVSEAVGVETGELEKPLNPKHGDLAYPCFALAKKEKKSPVEIAEEAAEEVDCSEFELIKEVRPIGPYINFVLDYDRFAERLVEAILKEGDEFGRWELHGGRKALVEFPSVNPNKPWHIGHARNAVLGDTLANLLEAVGYDVVRTDYIDDLGLQVAKTLWGLKRFGAGEEKFDLALGKLYVKAEEEMEKPETEEEVRSFLKRMEEGGEIAEKAREMCVRCVEAQYETGYKLGVFHDLMVWESDIVESGLFKEALKKMKSSAKIAEGSGEKEGCLVADFSELDEFSGMKDAEKVLLRSDGTATYAAKDIAFQMWKCGLVEDPFRYAEFTKQENGKVVETTSREGEKKGWGEADIVVNVIGMPQAHAQRMVFSALRLLGEEEAFEKSYHLSYSKVSFEEGGEVVQFSGRKGNWVDYTVDNLVSKAEKKAKEEVEKRNPDLEGKEEVARAVGRGAVRYALLRMAPEKEIVFRWEEALSFEGDAAPYLQYAHARACRILEKREAKNAEFELEGRERLLVRKLAEFPSLVKRIPGEMKHEVWGTSVAINSLCEYCCELASEFNSFYGDCRVLGSEKEGQRLLLVKAFQQVMKNALTLLGIEPVRKM